MRLISRVTFYDQSSGAEFMTTPPAAIALDPLAQRRTYQIKLSAAETQLIELLFSMIRPVEFRLPRWVGQNKRRG